MSIKSKINNLGSNSFVIQLKKIFNEILSKINDSEKKVKDLKEVQEVIKTDVEELKKGGGSVEVDETYLTKDEEGKITFGNNGTVGKIESPIIIEGTREGVTSILPGSVIVEIPSGGELKLTPDSLELTDGISYSQYTSRGISHQKGDERITFINLPEPTDEDYNLPLTVNGVKADTRGNIEIPKPNSNGEDEVRINAVLNADDRNSFIFNYLGYFKENVEIQAFEIIYNRRIIEDESTLFGIRVLGDDYFSIETFDKDLINDFIRANKGKILEVDISSGSIS